MVSKLKIKRIEHNLTQYDLAILSKVPQPVISMIEHRGMRPTRRQALNIAKALKFDVKDLWPDL